MALFWKSVMANLKVHFGRRLRELRRSAGITQEQLANEVGLTVESISNIERGIFGPRFDNLESIAQTLNVPVKALFDFKDE
jgi:transcriptional regulator with XRE-family HTH domain